MRRRLSFLLVLVLALAFTGTAAAQADDAGWQASYWNNTTLTGDPVLVRDETEIDHDWGFESPANIVATNRFSARWTRTLDLPAGSYRFTVTVDDGARLWVNDELLIDQWQVQSERTYQQEIYLDGGPVPVTLEYFENTGLASVQLSWTPTTLGIDSWYGEYYNNQSLSGSPALIRDDAVINFNWGAGSPASDVIGPDNFSARWRRTLDLPAGLYEFNMTVDDGGRLWVDGNLLIDTWQDQAATTYSDEIFLPGGETPVLMEYYENGGQAVARLNWRLLSSDPGSDPTPGPGPAPEAIVVDNGDFAFTRGGRPVSDWHLETGGYGGNLLWTRNTESLPTAYNWAQWAPTLTPGEYEVEVYVPEEFSTTSQARYWISHANGFTLRVVNQSTNGGRWVSLGTFTFDDTGSDYVSLADVTFEADESRLVAFDAVRWTPTSAPGAGEPAASVSPTLVSPGDTVTVFGTGFPAGATVDLGLGPPNTEPFGQYGQAVVNQDGTVTMSFTMPSTWPNGDPIIDDLPSSNEVVALLITEDGTSALASFTYQP